MVKYTLNREQLKEHINAALSEAIYDSGVGGITLSSDYEDDMKNLADKTGETLDDDFLDSVAHYDNITNGPDGPVYPDRKKEEMDADWHDIDDQAKDTQAKYGYNAQELDRLNAFTDTVEQYLNDLNYNEYDDGNGFNAMHDYDRAEAEREHPMESLIREAIREALSEMADSYNHPEDSNGNQFASNHGIDAHKFAHNGVDAYWARKDQDKMHKKEQDSMKRNTKCAMDAADKRPLHRKGSLNRAFDESKSHINETVGGYVFRCYRKGIGNDSMIIDDLNVIKPYVKDATYWDIAKGWNTSEPENLVAWGGQGGYWDAMLEDPKLSPRVKQHILSKRKDIGGKVMSAEECKLRRAIREALTEMSDDDAYWKQEQDDELNYDMKEFIKAMQKANGTYHKTSSDGQWKTGDRVIVHGRNQTINGVIKDFGSNIMTWEEDCDVDYEKDGRTWTLLGVPLNKLERVQSNESKNTKGKKLNEEWYPEDEDDISDYSYGAIMQLNVDGIFDEVTPEKVQELSAVHDEYIDNANKYTSVMVRKINLVPDGFDGYDVSVEVAVTAPDMPMDEIENETQELVWYWIEKKLGVRSPNVYITDEKVVFDRRAKNAQH